MRYEHDEGQNYFQVGDMALFVRSQARNRASTGQTFGRYAPNAWKMIGEWFERIGCLRPGWRGKWPYRQTVVG